MNFKRIFNGALAGLICLDLILVLFLIQRGFSNNFLLFVKIQVAALGLICILSLALNFIHGREDKIGDRSERNGLLCL